MSDVGKFVWHDLMCVDPEKGKEFYTDLFGWTVQDVEMGGEFGTYRMLHNKDVSIGGIVKLEPEMNVPSHWIGYVNVDDIDACCERVGKAGGQTCVPPTQIPNVGKFAVITDPTGAVISPFQGDNPPPPQPDGPPPAGTFVWEELLTTDPARCAAFYGEVFGWTTREMDMGPDGTYHIFAREGGKDTAGMMQMPPGAQSRPHWVPYVGVPDVEASTNRLKELGGTNYVMKEVPGVGPFSVNSDPFQATIALYGPKELS